MASTDSSSTDDFDALLDQYRRATYLGDAEMLLSWDQEVMMPESGTPARAKQRGALSALQHELLVDDEVGAWLEGLTDAELSPDESAVYREIKRQYERKARVPTSLVQTISETTSDAHPVWQEAKETNDFAIFQPTLERLLDLKREYAAQIDPKVDPYAVLFAEYEPYLDLETAEQLLEQLRDSLVPLLEAIRDADVDLFDVAGQFPAERQVTVAHDALEVLGYDFDRGRLDTAPHPFSTGTQFDARVTTRFDESKPLDSLGSTIHEFGHACYTQGLRQDAYGSPLGEHRGLTVHESQSRLWENHVGRSRGFWEFFVPRFNQRHDTDLTPQQAYEAINQVSEDNAIRVEADELTYHLHIILRFEIERDLIADDLDVSEIPSVWNDKMEEYLGIRPATDADGCLQDIHWSHGAFGYFPTYSLGSVLAAQLYAAVQRQREDLTSQIQTGDFHLLHDWLTENVHRHGQRYPTDALIERATGEPLTADYFIEYAETKFGELYDLSHDS